MERVKGDHPSDKGAEFSMTGIAIVTGGTRGIGAAVTKALKKEGYQVAAIYHGNDVAAERFARENAVPIFKWDVSDEAACLEGTARVEQELGPVSVLVNNARSEEHTSELQSH